MRTRRPLKAAGVLAAAALVLTACSGGAADGAAPGGGSTSAAVEGVAANDAGGESLSRGEPRQGGSLRTSTTAPVESLDPAQPVASGAEAMMLIFDVLLTLDADGNVVPELAESMETTDGGTTWVMTLPKGVAFTDGTPFNAAAVISHLQRIAAEGSTSREAGDIRKISSIESPDDLTVVFTLPAPSMTFPKLFTIGRPGAPALIPSPTAVEEQGEAFGLNPVGAGPFMLESFQPGGDIVLRRNPDYRIEGVPYLDELVFVNATDTQARLSAALAGDIDFARTASATDLIEAEQAGLVVLEQPSNTFYDLLFNLGEPPFDDIRFRKAVMHGIDLDALNQATFDGLHEPMTGVFPRSNPYHVDTDWPAYDPDAARALVQEWSADTGLAPEFDVTTTSPPDFQQMAAVMQQMLSDVGITMNIDVGDQPTMVTQAIAGEFQSQHRLMTVEPEVERNLRDILHSESSANILQSSDPEIDRLLDEARVVEGGEERREIYEQLQHRLAEWLPVMPLLKRVEGLYVNDSVGGLPGFMPGWPFQDARYIWAAE